MTTQDTNSLIVLFAIGAAAIGCLVPQLVERTSLINSCAALERLAFQQIARSNGRSVDSLDRGLAALSDGRVFSMLASEKAPNVPPFMTCLGLYYTKRFT